MRTINLVSSVSRAAGGLFDGVRRLSQSLQADQGIDVDVFGMEDEFTGADIGAWRPLTPKVFPVVGPRQFGYAPGLARALEGTWTDILHNHGLWMYPSTVATRIVRKTRCPLMISVHGMLDPWSVRNSSWKKWIARALYEYEHLTSAACIRVLSQSEARSVRQYGLRNPICVVRNGVDIPVMESQSSPPWDGKVPKGSKVLLYLGRLHPVKGLPNFLKSLAMLQRHGSPSERGWSVVLEGWDQGGHKAELEKFAAEAGLRNVLFLGPQYGEAKHASLSNADGFILPSNSEALPMAVLEAWAYGLPVVMTPECNLPEGFAARAALSVRPELASLANGLRSFFAMSDAQRREMGANGLALVREKFTWPTITADLKAVYEWMLGSSAQPSCVMLK